MARTHARIYAAIWQDAQFIALPAEAQRVYMLALSQPGVSFCGVVSFTARRWAHMAQDSTPETVRAAVAVLECHGFVIVDEDAEELWIRSFVRHDGVLESPNLVKRMWKDVPAIYSTDIRSAFLRSLPDAAWTDESKAYTQPVIEPSPNPLPNPSDNPQLMGLATPVPSPSPVPTPSPAAPAVRSRARDPIWDAVIECWRIEESELTDPERGRINKACGLIRSVDGSPEDIPLRRGVYQRRYAYAADTPMAVANRWAELKSDDNGQTPKLPAGSEMTQRNLERIAGGRR